MSRIPSIWSFERERLLPILKIQGGTLEDDGEAELMLVSLALIDIAKQYTGIPFFENKSIKVDKDYTISVFFQLIFSSEKKIDDFMQEVHEGNFFG